MYGCVSCRKAVFGMRMSKVFAAKVLKAKFRSPQEAPKECQSQLIRNVGSGKKNDVLMSDFELIMTILAIVGLIVNVLVLATRTKKSPPRRKAGDYFKSYRRELTVFETRCVFCCVL